MLATLTMKEMNTKKLTTKSDSERTQQGNVFPAFALFGCFFTSLTSVILAGTQDTLAGTYKPSTTVLLAGVVPLLIVDVIAPYFVNRIPNLVLVFTASISVSVGLIILAYADVEWKIAAVALLAFGVAVGTITIVSLTSYFEPSAVSAYSSGTGVGFLLGPLYYTALTTWFCVSPNTTLTIVSPLPLSYFVLYYFIIKNIRKKASDSDEEVVYTKIDDTDTEDVEDSEIKKERKQETKDKCTRKTDDVFLSRKEKMLILAKLFSLTLVPGFIGFCSQYLLTQTVITTIAYKNAPFTPRDHYQYYFFIFALGEMIGRSHHLILSKTRLLYTPTRLLLWLFSSTEMLILCFAILESWYRFLPNVGILLFFVFFAGFTQGMVYVNMLGLLHLKFEGEEREFVMGYAVVPRGLGMFTAGLVGFFVEPLLLKHCISLFKESTSCLTRSESLVSITSKCLT
ncbi:protein BTN1-like [Actinia tenebrosa]|uniref:Battenin n=1 Tax=Actinia tenebrosa TaxID=6105 RepID=A0A6P8J8J7_ACTTE|nr:protein BTN1-like [Actinia tenebrosa]